MRHVIPTVEHLGEAGDVRHLLAWHAGLLDAGGGSTGGDDLIAQLVQALKTRTENSSVLLLKKMAHCGLRCECGGERGTHVGPDATGWGR